MQQSHSTQVVQRRSARHAGAHRQKKENFGKKTWENKLGKKVFRNGKVRKRQVEFQVSETLSFWQTSQKTKISQKQSSLKTYKLQKFFKKTPSKSSKTTFSTRVRLQVKAALEN